MGNSGKEDNQGSNFLTFATGALLGGALGTALGLFLAPKSGTEMRYQLSEGMHDAQEKTKQILGDTKNTIGQSVDKATKNLESTVHRVTEAFNAGRKAAKDSVSEISETTDLENSNKNTDKNSKSDIISDKINKSVNQDDKSDRIKNEKNQEAAKIGEEVTKKNKAEG